MIRRVTIDEDPRANFTPRVLQDTHRRVAESQAYLEGRADGAHVPQRDREVSREAAEACRGNRGLSS